MINEYFDKIWCLTGLNKERIEHSKKLFMDYKMDVDFFYNPSNPLYKQIDKEPFRTKWYDQFIIYNNKNNLYNNVINCFIGHYNIIKTSYILGYDKILILEDDIEFNNDINLDFILSRIPQKWDMLNFRKSLYYNNSKLNIKTHNIWINYSRLKNNYENTATIIMKCNCMYALNRKAMKYYLDYIDTHGPIVADLHFDIYNSHEFNIYCNNFKLVKEENHFSTILEIDNAE